MNTNYESSKRMHADFLYHVITVISVVVNHTFFFFAVVKMACHCAVRLVWEWCFCCGFRMQKLFQYCPEFSTGREESVLQAPLNLRGTVLEIFRYVKIHKPKPSAG
jgi:hypothetical protein